MKKDDVINLILKSLPGDYTYDKNKGLYVYKPDDNLRIAFDEPSEPSFEELWTENFPNKDAFTQLVSIYYDRTLFHKLFCVWVDDYRHLIPVPKSQDDYLTITSLEYKIGLILNHPFSIKGFDQALAIAGIKHL
ncbi:MAG: hypothetical protein LUQ38_09225 [Methanotrichaceae archaeon]|nr:hypothetical protein [Methanotrichaceae archaeon]MDD1758860.1 hypothetical protein [Methanotrichaceae archaeon]